MDYLVFIRPDSHSVDLPRFVHQEVWRCNVRREDHVTVVGPDSRRPIYRTRVLEIDGDVFPRHGQTEAQENQHTRRHDPVNSTFFHLQNLGHLDGMLFLPNTQKK